VRVAAFSAAPVSLNAQSIGGATTTIPITTTQELWVSDYGSAYGHIYGTVLANGALTTIAGDTISLNPGVTGYNYPFGITFDQTGKLWVSDYYNFTVTSYAPGSSTAITTVTTQHDPTGLATDPAGNIWIANDSIGIQELNPTTGSLVTNALASISGSFPFVAFNSSGVLYLTSNSGNSTSTVKGYLTTSATPQSSFMPGISPDGVAIDHEGDVWVCDHTSTTMVARTPAGVTVGGTTLSGLSTTTSVAVDGSDNIWVLESGDLKEFTRAGAQIGTTMNGPSGNYSAFAFSP
jgi:sugar lactone lactonase YvrE